VGLGLDAPSLGNGESLVARLFDDDARRRRALSGEFGIDAQRLELDRIAAESAAERSLFTSRQKWVVIVVSALMIASVIALAAIERMVPHVK
jgi:hypothetical protein